MLTGRKRKCITPVLSVRVIQAEFNEKYKVMIAM